MEFLRNQRGIILLEILLAMVVLEIGLLVVADLFSNCIMNAREEERFIVVLNLLRDQVELLEKERYNLIVPTTATLAQDVSYFLEVEVFKDFSGFFLEYKRLVARVIWEGKEYRIVTYRNR